MDRSSANAYKASQVKKWPTCLWSPWGRQSRAIIVAMIGTKGQLCPVLCHWVFASYWSLLWVTDCLVHWFSLNVQLSGERMRRAFSDCLESARASVDFRVVLIHLLLICSVDEGLFSHFVWWAHLALNRRWYVWTVRCLACNWMRELIGWMHWLHHWSLIDGCMSKQVSNSLCFLLQLMLVFIERSILNTTAGLWCKWTV